MGLALATLILEVAKEGLKTFNLIYADVPAEQKKAQALLWWQMIKPLYDVLLEATKEK